MSEVRAFTPKTQQALDRTLEATRKAMAEVRENMAILDEGRERAQQRIEVLTRELAQAKQASADAAASQKALQKELDRREALLAAGQEEAEDLRGQLRNASAENTLLSKQAQESLAAEKASADKLTEQLRELMYRLAEEQTEHGRVLAERDKDLQSAGHEIEEANSRAKNLSSDIDGLETRLSASEERGGTLQTQLEEAVQVRTGLENTLAEVNARLQKLTQENGRTIAALQEHVASLEKKNDELTAKLEEALDDVEGYNAQLLSERELRDALTVDVDVSRRVIGELRQALSEAQDVVAERSLTTQTPTVAATDRPSHDLAHESM